MEVPRRRVNTYGKATKKILVHDLFNVSSKEGNLYEPFRPPTIDNFLRIRTGTPLSELSEDPETSQQLQNELQAAFGKSKASSSAPSSRAHSQTPSNAASPAVFDLASSEEEMPPAKPPAKVYKRRRVAPKPTATISDKAIQQIPASPRLSEDEGRPTVLDRNKATENKMLAVSNEFPAKRSKATVNAGQEPGPIPRSEPAPIPITKSPRSPHRVGTPGSEKSTDSMVSTRSTPKRKREVAEDILSDVSSPSQLELSSLRLTPARRNRAKGDSVDLDQSDSSMATPSRNRRRIVDKLDSPRKQSKTRDVGMKHSSPRPSKVRKMDPELQATSLMPQLSNATNSLSQPQIQRDDSDRSGTSAPKVRTYGKQRSHLKNMMSGLESHTQASSQTSLQHLVSQVDSLTTAKEPFEIESEDEDPGTRLKSIHELRQAGLANRFDRDLETLLEDVESGNKALRIQALMQLVRKLQEQSFKRMLLESGKIERLTSISRLDLDLVSASVLLLAFWAMAVSETATAQALSLIYVGILNLPLQIICETRSIFRIARDRQENLSKALVRDLADFENHVVDQSLSAGRQTSKHIIISRVALRSLEFTLKRLIELAEPVPEPSAEFVNVIVRATGDHVRAIHAEINHVEHVESMRLLVLWLEMTAATSRKGLSTMHSAQLTTVSQTLAQVMAWARKENAAIQQSCIRSAVELSNANTKVCDHFGRTELLDELFLVIEEHFSHLNRAAEDTQGEEINLDSVILAVGCLLNLMDHSSSGRPRMLEVSEAGVSKVDILVNFFKQHVEETEEAISEAQIQLLIPFGYVVLLLCTLCLDESIRRHVAGSMEGTGMVNLVNKAEVFLSRMKAVDSDSFVDRFSTTIDAVKENLVCG